MVPRRPWLPAATAIVVGVVLGASCAPTARRPPSSTATKRPAPSVIASPSTDVANGQTIQVTVQGFPADQPVELSECPTANLTPSPLCSSAPTQGALTTNQAGTATGPFVVEYSVAGFEEAFSEPGCGPACLLVAITSSSSSGPAVMATTGIAFSPSSILPLPPSDTPGPTELSITGASFINPDQGWALLATRSSGVIDVVDTSDGGNTWSYLPPPPTGSAFYSPQPLGITDIAFANASDGYLYAPGLWVTTDGGKIWGNAQLTGIETMTFVGSDVYALTGYFGTGNVQLYRAPLGSNEFEPVELPASTLPGENFKMTAAGTDLVLLETGTPVPTNSGQVGQLWMSSDQGLDWQPRRMPCTVADGGATVLSVAPGHPQAWVIDCYNPEESPGAIDTEQHLYGSLDRGQTWVRLANPPQHGYPALLADNGAEHAFIATVGEFDTVFGTVDGGGSWTVAIQPQLFLGWADLDFVSADEGFVVGVGGVASNLSGQLYRTTDGGASWEPVAVSP